jgi:hypothetical protein
VRGALALALVCLAAPCFAQEQQPPQKEDEHLEGDPPAAREAPTEPAAPSDAESADGEGVTAPATAPAPEAAVEHDNTGNRVGRVAASFGAAILGGGIPTLLWLPFFAFNSPDWPLLLVVSMALEPLAIATAAWLAHRGLGGKGLWSAGLVGVMAGAAVGGGAIGLVATQLNNNRNQDRYFAVAIVGASLFSAAMTIAGLELSNDRNSEPEIEAAVAPMPGGGGGVLRLRF